MTRSSSPARRIIVAEAASDTAGAGPRERSVSMVARLPCIARGCAVTTAMKLRCRPGGLRPHLGGRSGGTKALSARFDHHARSPAPVACGLLEALFRHQRWPDFLREIGR